MIRRMFLFLFFASGALRAQSPDVIYVSGSTEKICQLVGDYDRERQMPTQNLTDTRYHLWGTDLGVPFRHAGRIYLLFGDTIGARDGDAIAYTTDTNPEDGIDLIFLHNSSGTYLPVNIPGISQGAFEVPMEGTSVNGRMYVYHTTNHSNTVAMGASIVAVSEDSGHTFRYLYDFSSQHFINVSVVEIEASEWSGFPLQSGAGLAIFGSGPFRQSDVRLAFQPAAQIEQRESLRYFAGLDPAGQPRWSNRERDAVPLFSHPYVGELSVTYNRYLGKWLMLYNAEKPRGINFRTADHPWGPWSPPQVLFDPWEDGGYGHFIHVSWQYQKLDSVHDPGHENEWGGEYGPYQFEDLATGNDSTTTIYFTLSTWNPYTVVLMKSTLKRTGISTAADPVNATPGSFWVWPNYPNPFNPGTEIVYQLPQPQRVEIRVYDTRGRQIIILFDGNKEKGRHRIRWNGRNHAGQLVGGGVYFLQIRAGKFTAIRKMVLIR